MSDYTVKWLFWLWVERWSGRIYYFAEAKTTSCLNKKVPLDEFLKPLKKDKQIITDTTTIDTSSKWMGRN